MIQDIKYIRNFKGSKVSVILGCGSTINDITKREWKCIGKCDTFTLNYFLYHNFIPKFYYLELKNRYFEHWKKIRETKGKAYDKVKFIVPKKKYKKFRQAIGKNDIFTYEQFQNWNAQRENIKLPDNFRLHPKKLTKAYCGSLSLIVDIVFKMSYDFVIFYGIDLITSEYFWTDNPLYKDVHTNTNKGYVKTHHHNTFGMQNYLYEFYTRFCKNKQKWYIGSPKEKTVLSKYFKHKDIYKLV